MSIEYVFAGLAVTHVDAAINWYERLIGRPPDMLPNEREAVWRVTETASVYVVADEDRAGGSTVTMFVDDLDAELAGVSGRDISVGEVETAPGLFRKVVISDPDGNTVQLAELPSEGG
jgi:catechol 2,3-dioxygenase-like lactoylglutathione lyase family enzyme